MTSDSQRHSLDSLGRLLPEPLILMDGDGLILDYNDSAQKLFQSHGDVRGFSLATLVDDGEGQVNRYLRTCRGSPQLSLGALAFEGQSYRCEGAVMERGDTSAATRLILRLLPRAATAQKFRLLTDQIDALAREVYLRKRAELLLTRQLRALEMIAVGEPIARILDEIVKITESHATPGVRVSILVLDDEDRLRIGAAPGLPDEYNAAIDGLSIGPSVGSCGTAIHDKRTVVCEDIASDPLWANFKHLALPLGLRACWSTPVLIRGSEPGGAFALYYDHPNPKIEADETLVSVLTRLTAIALETARVDRERQDLLQSERIARADAESANRSRDEFLAVASHELRNPLHAMLGWAAVLREPELDEETRQTGVSAIERNAKLQAQIVSELLDFSRITAGKVTLEPQTIRLQDVVRDSVESLRPAAKDAQLVLELDLGQRMETIKGDPVRLQQAITNLITNAIKFTQPGGTIRISLDYDPDNARLRVTDTGVGIEPEFLPHVFDVFRQADVSKRRESGGLGLGLSIVRSITDLHGGHASAHSDGLGQGSTFTLELPLAPTEIDVEPMDSGAAPSLAGNHVLVVDDEEDARRILEHVLVRAGARVTVADSGAAGLLAVEEEVPDLIVSDIAMPEMDGHDFLRRLRTHPDGEIPALAITAHARAKDRDEAFAAGFSEFLPKPVNPEDVLRRLAAMNARRSGRDTE